jgi:hypothetical protein
MRPFIFLDIDGVLATSHQFHSNNKKWPDYGRYRFDDKCVKIFNEILKKTNGIIVLSSDWKLNYSINALNNIFEINRLEGVVTDITPSLWGVKYKNVMTDLEVCRAEEILMYVNEHKITNYVAIDDLDLSPWIPNNFIRTPRANEGIKQSSVKNKILKVLNYE